MALFGRHTCNLIITTVMADRRTGPGPRFKWNAGIAISTPPSACMTMISFNQPGWPIRNTLPESFERPPPNDRLYL